MARHHLNRHGLGTALRTALVSLGPSATRNMGPLRRAFNFASIVHFSFTRVRPLSSSLRLLHTIYGHHFGAEEDLTGHNLRIKLRDRWYPLILPPRTSMHLLLQVLRDAPYEPIATFLNQPRTIIDCGANIGLTVLYLADRFTGSVVHAFEPSSENFRVLGINTYRIERCVVLNQLGVSNSTGYATLHLGDNTEVHSLRPELLGADSGSSERVRLVRLDDYLEQNHINRVDLLKLDVEGAELDALKGLGERIRDVRVIVGELHLMAVSEREFSSFLQEKGFNFEVRSRPARHIAMFEAENCI